MKKVLYSDVKGNDGLVKLTSEIENFKESKSLANLSTDIIIFIAKILYRDHDRRSVLFMTLTCHRFYELQEKLMLYGILLPFRSKGLNKAFLGAGYYETGKGLISSLGVFSNGNILVADNSYLHVYSHDRLKLICTISPRKFYRFHYYNFHFLHACILPDNSIAVISQRVSDVLDNEIYVFDIYDPKTFKICQSYPLASMVNKDSMKNIDNVIAWDIKSIEINYNKFKIKVIWEAHPEIIERLEFEYPEIRLKKHHEFRIIYQYQNLKYQRPDGIFYVSSLRESTLISYPKPRSQNANWPDHEVPVKFSVELVDGRHLGYHAVEDKTPVRVKKNHMIRNCFIFWYPPAYLQKHVNKPLEMNDHDSMLESDASSDSEESIKYSC